MRCRCQTEGPRNATADTRELRVPSIERRCGVTSRPHRPAADDPARRLVANAVRADPRPQNPRPLSTSRSPRPRSATTPPATRVAGLGRRPRPRTAPGISIEGIVAGAGTGAVVGRLLDLLVPWCTAAVIGLQLLAAARWVLARVHHRRLWDGARLVTVLAPPQPDHDGPGTSRRDRRQGRPRPRPGRPTCASRAVALLDERLRHPAPLHQQEQGHRRALPQPRRTHHSYAASSTAPAASTAGQLGPQPAASADHQLPDALHLLAAEQAG